MAENSHADSQPFMHSIYPCSTICYNSLCYGAQTGKIPRKIYITHCITILEKIFPGSEKIEDLHKSSNLLNNVPNCFSGVKNGKINNKFLSLNNFLIFVKFLLWNINNLFSRKFTDGTFKEPENGN